MTEFSVTKVSVSEDDILISDILISHRRCFCSLEFTSHIAEQPSQATESHKKKINMKSIYF